MVTRIRQVATHRDELILEERKRAAEVASTAAAAELEPDGAAEWRRRYTAPHREDGGKGRGCLLAAPNSASPCASADPPGAPVGRN